MSATAYRAEVGPMIGGLDVERAIQDTLRAWLPAYICEAERLYGWDVGKTPWPKGWAITGRDLAKLTSDQLPCIVLMAGGTTGPPSKSGAPGKLTATWAVDVGSVFNAAWGRSSRQHAQLYAVAIRTCLTQRPLEGLRCVVDARGEAYDEMDFESSRSYSASVCSLNVTVPEIGWADGGPPPAATTPTDPHDPFVPWVEVVDSDIEVDHYPPPESLPQQ